MTDVGINYEIWTPAASGNFKRKTDITQWILPGTIADLRLVDLPSGVLKVSTECPDLDKILKGDRADHTNDVGSTLMLFRDGTWVAALVPTRRRTVADEKTTWVQYQLEGLEWYFDKARIKAFDNPVKPIKEGDWLYGAPTVLTPAGGEISNAQWFLDVTGASTGNYQITDGTDNTANIAWNETSPSVIKTRLETDITAIIEVAVSGNGTPEFPFIIILTDPAETDLTLTITADTTDGTVTLDPVRAGGTPSPRPWHGSIDGNTGVVIGNYQNFDMVAVSAGGVPAAPAGSASTHLLRIDASTPDNSGDYAGGQVEANLASGHRHRAEINAWSDTAQTIRFVLRTLTEDLIEFDQQDLAADTWTLMSIPQFILNEGVGTIVYRVGIIVEGDADVVYLDVNEAVLAPGTAAQNFGEIATDVLVPMTARGVVDWLVETWDATNDSGAVAWDRDLSQGLRKGQSLMHFLEYEARWGYERSIRYNSGNPAATPFDLNLHNPGGRDDNPTDVSVSALDGMISASPIEEAAPDFSTAIAEGADGAWGEATDANLATGWGKLEGYFANKQGRDSLNLDALAAQMVADSASETVTHGAVVRNPRFLFGQDFILGDTIPVIVHGSDGSQTPQDLRLVACTIEETDGPLPLYHYSFGAVVFDAEAAQADALRTLIRRFQALDELGGNLGTVDPVTVGVRGAASSGLSGAFVHLERGATQSIAAAGEAISWDLLGLLGAEEWSSILLGTDIIIPKPGYYDVAVSMVWGTFTEGGNIKIQRTRAGVTLDVWPPANNLSWVATDGAEFTTEVAKAISCRAGDILKVILDPDDASAQNMASATVDVELVEHSPAITDSYRELVLSHGPLAYWRLGELSGTLAADETGNGWDMAYTSTPTLGVTGIMRDGHGDRAADFASPEHVLGQDWSVFDFASGPFSIEAWFNADALSGTTSIIVQKRTGGGTGWELGATTSDIFFAGNGTTGAVRTAAPSIDTDYHVVATSDGTTERIYLNGVEVDSDTAMSISTNTEVLSIAYDVASSGFALDGTADEVALYDRELSAGEIAEHYAVGTRA